VTLLAAQAVILPFLGALCGLLLGPWLTRVLVAGGVRTDDMPAAPPTEARGVEEHVEAVPGVPGEPVPEEGRPAAAGEPGGGSRGALGPVLFAVLPTAATAVLTLLIALTVWRDPGTRTGTLRRPPAGRRSSSG